MKIFVFNIQMYNSDFYLVFQLKKTKIIILLQNILQVFRFQIFNYTINCFTMDFKLQIQETSFCTQNDQRYSHLGDFLCTYCFIINELKNES